MRFSRLNEEIHQSYFVVAMAIGVIAGVIIALVFKVNYFASPLWIIFATMLLLIAYLKPRLVFFAVALLAGMVLAFFRCTAELSSQQTNGDKNPEENLVLSARDWFAGRIEGLIPEPEVKLGLSYLLGMRSGLPDELNEDLKTVGLVHIVVASGAHLAILVEIARKICGKVSRLFGIVCSIGFILFFMCMVGWTPSIMRAGIMTILTLIAWYYGRKIEPWRIILLVMAATLMISPSYITNLGWLLSFASYGGIMILGPKLTTTFYGKKKPGFVAATIITTLSATLMTLPITLYYFGQISLISVVANLLILPTLPLAMGLVFTAGVVAGIPGLEIVAAWCAKQILDYHITVVGWFGGMRTFLVEMPRYQWWVYLMYIPIVAFMIGGLIRRKVVKLREAR